MYIKPIIMVEEAEVVSMLAESLVIDKDTTVDGGDALTKESSWEIWSDDKEQPPTLIVRQIANVNPRHEFRVRGLT